MHILHRSLQHIYEVTSTLNYCSIFMHICIHVILNICIFIYISFDLYIVIFMIIILNEIFYDITWFKDWKSCHNIFTPILTTTQIKSNTRHGETEAGIYKRKQENKNSTKKKRKFFFYFSWSLSWSSSCFLVFLIALFVEFLFSIVNSHLSGWRREGNDE